MHNELIHRYVLFLLNFWIFTSALFSISTQFTKTKLWICSNNERKNKMVQRRCWIEKKNQSRVLTITSRSLQSFKIWMIFWDILKFYKKVTYGCDWVYVCSSNCLLKISFQFICHMQSLEWIQYFVNASWKFYSFK